MSLKIGFLGVGHLAQHLVPGLVDGGHPAGDIVLSPRNRETAGRLSEVHGVRIAASNEELVRCCDAVLITVRPFQIDDAAAGLPWRHGQTAISLCAGVGLDHLKALIPDAGVARAMPVTAGKFGASPTVLVPDNAVARSVLERLGPVHAVATEELFDACAPVATHYVWIQELIRLISEEMQAEGVPSELARALAAQMAIASGTTAEREAGVTLDELVRGYRLPESLSDTGLRHLEEAGAIEAWRSAFRLVRDVGRGKT